MLGSGRILALAALAAFMPADLDVDTPTGTPFEQIKVPKDSPKVTPTKPVEPRPNQPPPTSPGKTVVEDPKKIPPPRPPTGLPGVTAPTTIDYQNHLGWKPKDELVEWKDPQKPDVSTGAPKPVPEPEKWDVKNYPPQVPNDLYVYAVTRYLMVMLHPHMVSERELVQYLIEIGYPSHYAATAARTEGRVKRMCSAVTEAVGPMVKTPPPKPESATAQAVTMDLISRYCYEPAFGQWILTQPTEVTLPALLDIVKTQRHPFLLRNAVFILRCFNVPEVVPPMRDLLMKTRDKVVRNRALVVLVRWQDEQIAEWLVKQAGGQDVGFRNLAAWAIGMIGAPSSIDGFLAEVRRQAGDGEFVWTAVPALARLGDGAPPEKRKQIEEFLAALAGAVDRMQGPPPTDNLQQVVVEPPDHFRKVLSQRIVIALARLGRPSALDQVKKFGFAEVLKPNLDFHAETVRLLK